MKIASNPSSRGVVWLVPALVLAYVALIWPALSGPFLFDDFPNLGALARVDTIRSASDVGIYLSEARSFPGRPLSMLTFLLQQASWPGNPFPFKLVNLLTHLLNGGLVFLLARQLWQHLRPHSASHGTLIAGLIAAAWLIHPMQLSAVLLVIQRMTLLSAFFVLAGLNAYLRGILSPSSSALRRGLWMTAGMACIVPAILSKENGILLPLLAWSIDATLLRDAVQKLPQRLRWLRHALLFPTIIFLGIFALYQLRDLGAPLAARNFTMAERLLTESRVVFDYLAGIVLPRYSIYSVYHDDFAISRGLLAPMSTLPAVLAIVSAFMAAVLLRKRWPLAAFGVLWFLAAHSLESGPISLELYFEHRNYLPLAGLLISIAFSLAGVAQERLYRAGVLAAGLWLGASLLATSLYAQVWTSADKLSYFWAQSHPASLRAQGDYAEMLFRNGDVAGARAVLVAAEKIDPNDSGLDVSIATIDCTSRSLTRDEIVRLRTKLRTGSWSRLAYQGLETLGQLAGRGTCRPALDEAAWTSLSDALLANPNFQADSVAVGYIHYLRHSQAVRLRDLDAALSELEATAKVDPDPEIVRLQAKYLVDAGRSDTAIELLEAYDESRRPLLRRLLVDDAAINRDAIATIRAIGASQVAPRP